MKLIIAGSRDMVVSKEVLDRIVATRLNGETVTEVVCGGATGIDTSGLEWAQSRGIPVKMFPANWKLYGKSAGPRRNREMGDYSDAALVIYNGSTGSQIMIDYMKELGKLCVVIKL